MLNFSLLMKKWRKWSLPSKLTAYGALFGALSLFLSIFGVSFGDISHYFPKITYNADDTYNSSDKINESCFWSGIWEGPVQDLTVENTDLESEIDNQRLHLEVKCKGKYIEYSGLSTAIIRKTKKKSLAQFSGRGIIKQDHVAGTYHLQTKNYKTIGVLLFKFNEVYRTIDGYYLVRRVIGNEHGFGKIHMKQIGIE